MRKSEITVGNFYRANVSGNRVTVQLNGVRESGGYNVTNCDTGRELVFKTAARFLAPTADPRADRSQPPGPWSVHKSQGATVTEVIKQTSTVVAEPKAVGGLRAMAERKREATEPTVQPSSQTNNAPHVIIVARAGTGKTTTGIGGLQVMRGGKPAHQPSPQQLAIFEQFKLSSGARRVAMVAFNKSIATELQSRVPEGVEAMTLHSLGYKAVRNGLTVARGKDSVNGWKVRNTLEDVSGKSLRKMDPMLVSAVDKLVGLCKTTLTGEYDGDNYHIGPDDLDALTSRYDIEVDGCRIEAYDYIQRILERHANFKPGDSVDFNDMIWLPVVKRLPVFRYDLLFVDECQDTSNCHQSLAFMAGKRLIFCGDDRQAIYGFAGADCHGIETLYDRLSRTDRGCVKLPLTVTYRCGQAIVERAREIVPDYSAHEKNGPGSVLEMQFKDEEPNHFLVTKEGEQPVKMLPSQVLELIADWVPSEHHHNAHNEIAQFVKEHRHGSTTKRNGYLFEAVVTDWRQLVKGGDMVLSRVNAPLISECFKLLKRGIKAQIQGRDIGKNLISLISKFKANTIEDLCLAVDQWRNNEVANENKKRNPSESRLIMIDDKADCLLAFCEEADSPAGVIEKINRVFTDDRKVPGVLFSSIHKAKGMEADRVWLLRCKDAQLPHPMARAKEAREQEFNLLYVGVTRAIAQLTILR